MGIFRLKREVSPGARRLEEILVESGGGFNVYGHLEANIAPGPCLSSLNWFKNMGKENREF